MTVRESENKQPISAQGGNIVGQMVLGQFRVLQQIGAGGMATIFLAEQIDLNRKAVIKVLCAGSTGGNCFNDMQARFRREARIASNLNHPNIVTVFNFGQLDEGQLFIAMEYVEGVSLKDMLKNGPFPPRIAAEIILQCANALAYAHKNKVIHRDFKPANVIVSFTSGRPFVKILDFGIAHIEESTELTKVGSLIGTPQYMSPEQCRGEPTTPFSDQYSLGLVFYEMLTGRPVFSAESPIGYIFQHQCTTPALPSVLTTAEEIKLLNPVVMRLLEKEPENRYTDLEEAFDVLRQIVSKLKPVENRAIIPFLRKPTSHHIAFTSASNSTTGGDVIQNPSTNTSENHVQRPRAHHSLKFMELGREALTDVPLLSAFHHGEQFRWERCIQPDDFAIDGLNCDGYVLHLPQKDWMKPWKLWRDVGLQPQNTLFVGDWLDSPNEFPEIPGAFNHIMAGALPLDPCALNMALLYLAMHNPMDKIPSFASQGLKSLKIKSSFDKSQYLDEMLDDLEKAGVRRFVHKALRMVCDEMIMNAIFNAPVSQEGLPRFRNIERSNEVTLQEDEQATLSWMISEKYVIVAVRDSFGSISPAEIISRVINSRAQPNLSDSGSGAGIGLYIMSRTANHLIFAIYPGLFCEVVAFISREPENQRRSLAILYGLGREEHPIGKDLWYSIIPHEEKNCIRLKGEINESSDLHSLFQFAGPVWVDMSEVKGINSTGIILWLKAFAHRHPALELHFERCSEVFVSQINIIPELAETGNTVSIMAPYYCQNCKKEFSLELKVEEIIDGREPLRNCQTCNQPLEFDDLPKTYFAFLKKKA